MTKSTLDVLTEAYHLLDDKKRWTQGALARDFFGEAVSEQAATAVAFCAAGAVYRVIPSGKICWDALDLLEDVVEEDLTIVNDGPDGYRRIRAAFRKAIRSLGGKP